MKILIIIPNNDQQIGKAIQESAEDFAKGRFDVVCALIIASGLAGMDKQL